MEEIKFDFNNMFSFTIGKVHGVTVDELRKLSPSITKAFTHLMALLEDARNRIALSLEWAELPYQSKKTIAEVGDLGSEIARGYESVLFLGIGGSYLGLKAAQDALRSPYYNEFEAVRYGRPRVYFEGNNLDPDTLSVLLRQLDPARTFVVVISKSGETTETKAAFALVEAWLRTHLGQRYGRQVVAITDPESGTLRKKVAAQQARDTLSFRNLPLLKGVGGRYSEFNAGLLHLAIAGVDIGALLVGAREMAVRCRQEHIFKNPALLYAALHAILYLQKQKPIVIMMPFSERLKSTADWYSQLLAESLGKKFPRKITFTLDGQELWERDTSRLVNIGRTPVATRGTSDLHSIQQNNVEGQNDKAITFIKVKHFTSDLKVTGTGDFLSGNSFSYLLNLAQEATQWALVKESRPNCTIIMPEITPYHWGGLLYFFEMATAFEGELLNVNAFDQPGVEGYKNYMYAKLKKPCLAPEVARQIRTRPLVKKARYIV